MNLAWLYFYISGSIIFIIYHRVFIQEKEFMFNNKKSHYAFIFISSYIFGYFFLPLFILLLIVQLICMDYAKYKMKFDEQELRKYRIEDSKRILAVATNLLNNGKLKESLSEIDKAKELLEKTI